MKILVVADYPVLYRNGHIHTDEIYPVDLILSCGDLPYEYLRDLSFAFDRPVYFVKGNHDIRTVEGEGDISDGCMEIHRKVWQFGNLTILGIGGSNWYNGGDNQYTEDQMKRMLKEMEPDIRKLKTVDIMLTHAPPRHINDRDDMCHRGFNGFRKFIAKYKPRYLLHGHIHDEFSTEDERTTLFGETEVINCFGYHCLEIDEHETSV